MHGSSWKVPFPACSVRSASLNDFGVGLWSATMPPTTATPMARRIATTIPTTQVHFERSSVFHALGMPGDTTIAIRMAASTVAVV